MDSPYVLIKRTTEMLSQMFFSMATQIGNSMATQIIRQISLLKDQKSK